MNVHSLNVGKALDRICATAFARDSTRGIIMSKQQARNYSPDFKAEVALAAIRGGKTLDELAVNITPTPIRSPPGACNCRKALRRCSPAI